MKNILNHMDIVGYRLLGMKDEKLRITMKRNE